MNAQSVQSNRLNLYHYLALTGYFSLFFVLIINIIWLIPPKSLPIGLVLIVLVGPLLFPLFGLLNLKTYTYQWTSFLSLAYFAHGISEIAAYPSIWYAGVMETLAATLLYLGCVMYARYFKQQTKKLKAQQDESSMS